MTDQEQAIAKLLKEGKSQTAIVKLLAEQKVTPADVKRVKAALAAEQLGNAGAGATGAATKTPAEVAASGAGNLSSEERAKLMGDAGQGSKGETPPPESKPEMSPDEIQAQLKAMDFSSPLDFAKRLVTAEQHIGRLTGAVEVLAEHARAGSARPKVDHRDLHAQGGSGPLIQPATPDEERAYSISRNEGAAFNNIQEWRDAGSPGLAA